MPKWWDSWYVHTCEHMHMYVYFFNKKEKTCCNLHWETCSQCGNLNYNIFIYFFIITINNYFSFKPVMTLRIFSWLCLKYPLLYLASSFPSFMSQVKCVVFLEDLHSFFLTCRQRYSILLLFPKCVMFILLNWFPCFLHYTVRFKESKTFLLCICYSNI